MDQNQKESPDISKLKLLFKDLTRSLNHLSGCFEREELAQGEALRETARMLADFAGEAEEAAGLCGYAGSSFEELMGHAEDRLRLRAVEREARRVLACFLSVRCENPEVDGRLREEKERAKELLGAPGPELERALERYRFLMSLVGGSMTVSQARQIQEDFGLEIQFALAQGALRLPERETQPSVETVLPDDAGGEPAPAPHIRESDHAAGESDHAAGESDHAAGESDHAAGESDHAAGKSDHAAGESARAAGESARAQSARTGGEEAASSRHPARESAPKAIKQPPAAPPSVPELLRVADDVQSFLLTESGNFSYMKKRWSPCVTGPSDAAPVPGKAPVHFGGRSVPVRPDAAGDRKATAEPSAPPQTAPEDEGGGVPPAGIDSEKIDSEKLEEIEKASDSSGLKSEETPLPEGTEDEAAAQKGGEPPCPREEADAQRTGWEAGGQPAALQEDLTAAELDQALNALERFLAEGRFAEGMLYLRSLAPRSDVLKRLCGKLGYILEDPLRADADPLMLADESIDWDGEEMAYLDDALNAAIVLCAFFSPENPMDYRLHARWDQIRRDKSNRLINRAPAIGNLLALFGEFLDQRHVGYKICTTSYARGLIDQKARAEQCARDLAETRDIFHRRNVKARVTFDMAKSLVKQWYGDDGFFTRMVERAMEMDLGALCDFCQQFREEDIRASESWDILPDEKRLERFLDEQWLTMKFEDARKGDVRKKKGIIGKERDHQKSWLREAVTPLLRCAVCRCAGERSRDTQLDPGRIANYRAGALTAIESAARELEGLDYTHIAASAGHSCVSQVLRRLADAFQETAQAPQPFYADLLRDIPVELDRYHLPMTEPWARGIPAEYTLSARLVHGLEMPLPTWEEAAERALRSDNMGCFSKIEELHPEATARFSARKEEVLQNAGQELPLIRDQFIADVEIAQNYGQISTREEMDNYLRLAFAACEHFGETQNYGLYKKLCQACRKEIQDRSDERMEATRRGLEALKAGILLNAPYEGMPDEGVLAQWPILDKIERMLSKRNMTVAEDYIQLAGNGKGVQDIPMLLSESSEPLEAFLEEYQALYSDCNKMKSHSLKTIYETYVRRGLFNRQHNRNTDSADQFIHAWSQLPNMESLKTLFGQLSYEGIVRCNRTSGNNLFHAELLSADDTLGQYKHPFAAFGSKAYKFGLRVLWIAGVRDAKGIFDEYSRCGIASEAATIVLLDYALPLYDRRKLANLMKSANLSEVMIVVDRVMALFLARFSKLERGNAMLKTALPFSYAQPYADEGKGVIPPEMFIGRTDALNKIRNLNGPVLVYGGRQLGKTALLRQVQYLDHHPESGSYAVFVELKALGSARTLEKLCARLCEMQILNKPCRDWGSLSDALQRVLAQRNVNKLILLMDEADAFVADCTAEGGPLEALNEVREACPDQFKFVLAGLRDVVRFDRRNLGGNSVLARLGHITIRPLAYVEARELLQRPLGYLGFRVREEDDYMVSLILAKTNYYPGLIHFYCQKLIEAVSGGYRNGSYDENDVPPYLVDEKLLKLMMKDPRFLNEINEKFRITLELGDDDLYNILANALAYHYHHVGVGVGASASEIIDTCGEFEIGKITQMTRENVTALLEEMVELNILRRDQGEEGAYMFNRYSIFQMLGGEDEVMEHLFQYTGR